MTATAIRIDGFAERILFIRTVKLRLHGTQMAKRLGVPHSTLKTWENGTKPQDILEVADRYVAACDEAGISVTADWILRGGFAIWSCLTPVDMPEGQMELALDDHAARVKAC